MKKDKPTSSFVNIGSSSLLIIFLILSLVTFSVLSLSSARSDYSFSQKLAAHKTAYYEASARAEQILSKIDETLAQCAETCGKDLTRYYETVTSDLTSADDVLLFSDLEDGRYFLSFEIPLSDDQSLYVKLEIKDYQQSETYYEIKAWKVVSTNSWESDQSIQLLPMGE